MSDSAGKDPDSKKVEADFITNLKPIDESEPSKEPSLFQGAPITDDSQREEEEISFDSISGEVTDSERVEVRQAERNDSKSPSYAVQSSQPSQDFRGDFTKNLQPRSAKRNFWIVTLWAFFVGVVPATGIAGLMYLVMHKSVNTALSARDSALKEKDSAEKNRRDAEQARDTASKAAETANANAAAAVKEANEANLRTQNAETQRANMLRERDSALARAQNAETERTQAVKAKDEAVAAAQAAKTSEQLAIQNLSPTSVALTSANSRNTELLSKVRQLESALGNLDVGNAANRWNAINILESVSPTSVNEKAKRARDLLRMCIRHATDSSVVNEQKEACKLKIRQQASELNAIGKSSADQSMVLDAIYAIGRFYEIDHNYEKAIDIYQRGIGQSTSGAATSNFYAAEARARVKHLRGESIPSVTAGASSPGAPLRSIGSVPQETILPQLDQALTSAQAGVGAQRSELTHYARGLVRLERGIYYQQTSPAMVSGIIDEFDGAIEDLESAMALSQQDPRPDSSSNLEEIRLEELTALYQIVNRLRREIPGSAELQGYRELAAVYRKADSMWSDLIRQLAEKMDYRTPLPGNYQRTNEVVVWFRPLLTQLESNLRERDRWQRTQVLWQSQIQQGNDDLEAARASLARFQTAEATWAESAVRIAGYAGLISGLPEEGYRWLSSKDETLTWIGDLEAAIQKQLPSRASTNEAQRQSLALYGDGVHQYFRGEFDISIQTLSLAISIFPRDARYYFFRGLARRYAARPGDLLLAEQDIRRGHAMAMQDVTSKRAAVQALERIQGPARQWLDSQRTKVTVQPAVHLTR